MEYKPYIIVSLGPKASKCESFEGKGYAYRTPSKAPLKESIQRTHRMEPLKGTSK